MCTNAELYANARRIPHDRRTVVMNVEKTRACDVYIGRSFKGFTNEGWGNPYRVTSERPVEQVVRLYEEYIRGKPELMARLPELVGKRLGCWCAPDPCHGNVLVKLVSEMSLE